MMGCEAITGGLIVVVFGIGMALGIILSLIIMRYAFMKEGDD